MCSLFHAFILCQLWTVYLEQIIVQHQYPGGSMAASGPAPPRGKFLFFLKIWIWIYITKIWNYFYFFKVPMMSLFQCWLVGYFWTFGEKSLLEFFNWYPIPKFWQRWSTFTFWVCWRLWWNVIRLFWSNYYHCGPLWCTHFTCKYQIMWKYDFRSSRISNHQ